MPRHPPNTLETLDRSHLQRPTPALPRDIAVAPQTGRSPVDGTSSALLLPSQHDRTIRRSGTKGPPRTTSTRNLLRTGLARSSRSSPCPTASTGERPRHTHARLAPGRAISVSRSSRHCQTITDGDRQRQRRGTGMVGQGRLELPTSRLSSARSNQLSYWPTNLTLAHPQPPLPIPCGNGGGGRVRTDDLRLAKPSLSQLSYAPMRQPAASPVPEGTVRGAASRGLDREGMRRRRSRGSVHVREQIDCFQPDP